MVCLAMRKDYTPLPGARNPESAAIVGITRPPTGGRPMGSEGVGNGTAQVAGLLCRNLSYVANCRVSQTRKADQTVDAFSRTFDTGDHF